jgi:hypothetical protein
VSVSAVVVINHALDLLGIVPEVAETTRVVVGQLVLLVHLVPQPSSEKGEELANVSRVGVNEGEGSQCSELLRRLVTANPAAGKAIRLFVVCSFVIE